MKNFRFMVLMAVLFASCALQEPPVSQGLVFEVGPDNSRAVTFPGTKFTSYASVATLNFQVLGTNGQTLTTKVKTNPSFPESFELDLPTWVPLLFQLKAYNGQEDLIAMNQRPIFLDGTGQRIRLPLMAGPIGFASSNTTSGPPAIVTGNTVTFPYSSSFGSSDSIVINFTQMAEGVAYSIEGGPWLALTNWESAPVTVSTDQILIPAFGVPGRMVRLRVPDGVGGFMVWFITLVRIS